MKRLQGFVAGVLTAAIVSSGVAFAKSKTETVEAVYDNIKVYIDNVLADPQDANGNSVEPFIMNGTTYLPVRGVASAMGADVTWDGNTKSVYIWDKMAPGGSFLVTTLDPYEKDRYTMDIYTTETFSMLGEKYSNGIVHTDSYNHSIYYNLNSKYSTLNFTLGHIDGHNTQEGAYVSIVVDGNTVKTIELEPEEAPRSYSVPLNYGLQMKIVMSKYVGMANITLD